MGSFTSFLLIYCLGGLTFIPLVLSLILLHAYLTFPSRSPADQAPPTSDPAPDPIRRPSDDQFSLKSGTDELAEKFHRTHESDVAAGYFAVCREYVPGGVNGKPPERTTPAGEVIAAESPSVYQAMYRSLFDRKQAPTIEPSKNGAKNSKKARNVFYIVLRHGHLMLYDDANQVEVRYVISLAHHDVTIHSGGEGEIPEGELWLKRNAICLSRRLDSLADLGGPTPPFFLFSENLSEKEDFYFAMLQNQSRMWKSPDAPPKHQSFDVKHIITLVQRLHSSEEQLQTRWINAVLGRLFLALYRTPQMEEFIRQKITKKISRVNKPNFISRIGLRKIDMGEGAPFIINPRLKDLTVDGNCCVETDIQYAGNFRVEISATVRIDLGQRFKAREVDIVLAVVLKKLEGHLLIRFKPPPSNRAWISFETMPNMVMDIEPIVSSKQITYGVILRAIESRIREVVAETLVLPFWDDIPFLDTFPDRFRGGIWEHDQPEPTSSENIPDESGTQQKPQGAKIDSADGLRANNERTRSAPALAEPLPTGVKSRQGSKSSLGEVERSNSSGVSSGVEKFGSSPPRAIRSKTFANVADPVVTADNVNIDKVVYERKSEEKSSATSAMIEISSRSPPGSPNKTPGGSPPVESPITFDGASRSREPSITESIESVGEFSNGLPTRPPSVHQASDSSLHYRLSGTNSSSASVNTTDRPRRRTTLENFTRSIASSSEYSNTKSQVSLTLNSATSAAKKWSWNVFGKGDQNTGSDSSRPAGTPEEPIGRGHPLPPPGTPLPYPEKFKKNSGPSVKRKPVPASRPNSSRSEENKPTGTKQSMPRRKPTSSSEDLEGRQEELLVVEAPLDSVPNSPVVDVAPDDGVPASSPEPPVSHLLETNGNQSNKSSSSERDEKTYDEEHRSQGFDLPKHGMEILSATDGIIP
ncbi:PH-domain-containing protein [Aspergillus terreus]|uniref:PH-domain-containing protein n=1 Tax=Aspergillus terreus TaxID=33178 RepID=A0A5M3Z9U1_ASPTE|nr:hypothetical protein ATETN484_0012033500 [Aspergillus terreus]GFF19583.1 PH-domain-containing protein [Aspergillus terreus]